LTGVLGLTCFLNIEKTGRRFWTGGGELRGTGEDGGLDRGGTSEKTADELFGLDGGETELERVIDEGMTLEAVSEDINVVGSVLSIVFSVRLRLVGGSSS
jgi:hypothetical protein